MHSSFGPLHCETLKSASDALLIEPLNAISNLFGVALSLLAFYLIFRRKRGAFELYILAMLLFLSGIGSFFWHGTREPWALTFDVLPAIIFLMLFIFLWPRFVLGKVPGYGFLFSFFAMFFSMFYFFPFGSTISPIILNFALVTLFGAILTILTFKKLGSLGYTTLLILGFALLAAYLRTIDLTVCPNFSLGTHFLWQIFISTSAFIAIIFILNPKVRNSSL